MMGMSTSQAEQDAAIALLTILKDPAAAKDNLQKLLDAQAIAIAQGQSAAEAKKAADAAQVNLDAEQAAFDEEKRAHENDMARREAQVASREATLTERERMADVRAHETINNKIAADSDLAKLKADAEAEIKSKSDRCAAYVAETTRQLDARAASLGAAEKSISEREATIAKREAAAIAAAAKREAAAKAAQEAADEMQARLQDRLTALKSAIAD